MKKIILENYSLTIGKNASDNWDILDRAQNDDMFFHLSHFPSPYVILSGFTHIDKDIIYTAATCCKQHSKYKNIRNIRVDYCLCSNLTKGEQVGSVYYNSNRQVKNIIV